LSAVQIRSGTEVYLGRGVSSGERLTLDVAPLAGSEPGSAGIAAKLAPLRVELLAPR
jgi:hypothetical protein